MTILGHGVDMVDISRIRAMLAEHGERFRSRCFTDREQRYCDDASERAAERFAARFAAKEAVLKALGTGWRSGIAWTDAEVVNAPSGAPELRVAGRALEIAQQQGIERWLVSLSHTSQHAIASVLALGPSPEESTDFPDSAG